MPWEKNKIKNFAHAFYLVVSVAKEKKNVDNYTLNELIVLITESTILLGSFNLEVRLWSGSIYCELYVLTEKILE